VILGFLPGLGLSWVLSKCGALRVSKEEEIEGLDLLDCGIGAYPETGAIKVPDPELPTPAGAPATVTKLATES